MLPAFGVAALSFMMLMYALERRGRGFILAFACGCLLSSAYGFLAAPGPSASSRPSGQASPCSASDPRPEGDASQ
jgi:hypothetical protein